MVVELHPHQQEAVDKMHNGCILYGGVGTGKSITSIAYFVSKVCKGTYNDPSSMRTPKDLYIITTAKKRDSLDWVEEAVKFRIGVSQENSISGVNLVVDSWNNIKEYVGVKDAFFIFDEQRVVGYGAWSRSFIKIAKHNEWILLSATPGDTWLDYIPVFIANGWYRNKTDFIDQHVIWMPRVKFPKVQRYQNVSELVRRRNQVLVHMPYERHTVRHPHYIYCDYDQDAFERVVKKRWHVYEERPLRDPAELFSVMRKVVNSDSSRIESVRHLLSKHKKLIVFYNFDYELEMLRNLGNTLSSSPEVMPPWEECRQGCPGCAKSPDATANHQSAGCDESCEGHWTLDRGDGECYLTCEQWAEAKRVVLGESSGEVTGTFQYAEWNGHKHEAIPATERWMYLVQYRAGAEGWNCVETDAIAFFSQTYSYRDWWQAHGRIDRLNTPFTDLHYYYLVSKSAIDAAIRRALKSKKSFNERDLAL